MDTREHRQVIHAEKMNGRQFLTGVAGIIFWLALGQIVCNLAISLTGIGLLNVLFYVFAVWLLLRFMRGTVAGSTYVLDEKNLILEKHLGDSTVSVVTIPRDAILSIRPAVCGEDFTISYSQITYMRAELRPSFRIRLACMVSVFSARLARKLAGQEVGHEKGQLIAFTEGKRHRTCIFDPDAPMMEALCEAFGDKIGWDDRLARPQTETLKARALQRAFPDFYPNVRPLISEEDRAWEAEESALRAQKKEKARAARVRTNVEERMPINEEQNKKPEDDR